MKIKTWLLLSYFIIMFLPLLAAYGLFVWINSYHDDRNVAEYMDNLTELTAVQDVLKDPSFYRPNGDWTEVEQIANDRLSITLYTDIGFMLYSSNPMKQTPMSFIPKEKLYKEFYELRQKFGTITYKEPVFFKGALVGVYEIELLRDEWVSAVERRSLLVIVLFSVFFIALFIGMSFLVNRKLNRPLHLLMNHMDSFAKGEQVLPMSTRKDEIGELAQSFEMMRRDLEAANRKLNDEHRQKEFMIASISHDLKTPLTSIRAYAEALQSVMLSDKEQQEYREVIITKSNYMKLMLDDLLMYTLLQSSTYEMEFVTVDGEEFFDMLVSGYETLCDEKSIELVVESAVIGNYSINTKQLMRVVDNIMSNAITHSHRGGRIELATMNVGNTPKWCFESVKKVLTQKDGMYLIVQNSGYGLSEEDLKRVFEPQFQADQARSKAGERGTGLGLSITKQIMEKHGGMVQMVSSQEIGTAIICWLPELKGEYPS